MKRVLSVFIVVFVLVGLSLSTFAAGLDDWTNLPGFIIGGNNTQQN